MQKPHISGIPGGGTAGRLARSVPAHIVLIILIGLLAYSNTLDAPFHMDDLSNIVENPLIKDLGHFVEPSSAEVLRLPGTVAISWKSRIAGYLSFALNYWADGLDVRGYHVLNLAIHLANALLVYWLALLTFRAPRLEGSALQKYSNEIALFSGLIFVSHPVETQAVTYVVQRLASLATLFYLLSLCCYARARLSKRSPRRYAFYAVSLASAALAMKTKEIAFTLPAMAALYDMMFLSGSPARRLRYLLPLMLTMLIIPLSLLGVDRPLGEMIGDVGAASRLQSDISRPDYLFTQFRVVATYLRLLALPVGQNLDYDYPVFHGFLNREVLPSFALLMSVFALGLLALRRSRKGEPGLRVVSFGILWFFVTISVESSLIPIADVIFEHRLYLPSAGIFMAVATGAFLLKDRSPRARGAVMPMLLAAVLVFAVAAHARNGVWKSEITLWEDTVRKSPGKTRPHNNLGLAYDAAGMSERAAEQFARAVELSSGYEEAVTNLGVAYLSMGKADEAIAHYLEALKRNPESGGIHYNLGYAYQMKGLNQKAKRQYEKAVALGSGSGKAFAELAHTNLGVIYLAEGKPGEAVAHLAIALSLNPYNAQAHNNLGNAYAGMGLTDKAIEQYGYAVKIRPDYAQAQYNLGSLYGKTGRLGEARQHLLAAVRARPDYSEAHNSLGNVYFLSGDFENAARHFALAIEHSPDNYQANYNLAVAYGQMGMEDKAREYFRRAEDIKKRQGRGPAR